MPYEEGKCADTAGTVPVPWTGNAKILIHFSNKIYGSNFIKQHSETVMVWFEITKMPTAVAEKISLCHLLYFSAHFRSPISRFSAPRCARDHTAWRRINLIPRVASDLRPVRLRLGALNSRRDRSRGKF